MFVARYHKTGGHRPPLHRRGGGNIMSFPKHWTTERVRVDSVCASEGEALTALFNSSTDVIDMDPTFYVVDVPEVMGLIEESLKSEAAERGFRMQAARLKTTGELVGYFHFHEGQ